MTKQRTGKRVCASIGPGVYEKFTLEAYVDGTNFHFSKERFCVSPWGRAENGAHPLLQMKCWVGQVKAVMVSCAPVKVLRV